jgi:hypothetical protein
MKKRRRQDLRTNELAQSLSELGDFFNRYGTYVLAAAAVIMVIIVSVWYTAYSREGSRRRAWERFYTLENFEPEQQLAGYRQLAEESPDTVLSASAWLKLGDTAWNESQSPETLSNSERRDELLRTARQAYEQVTRMSGVDGDVVAAARLGLAAVAEENHEVAAARQLYQVVRDAPGSAHTGLDRLAETALASLDQMGEPVTFAPAMRPPAAPSASASPAVQRISPDEVPLELRQRAAQRGSGEAMEDTVGPFLNPEQPAPVQPTTIPVGPGPTP